MIFVLPVGHERDELRRVPWVSITIAAVCCVVFGTSLVLRSAARKEAHEVARMTFAYASTRPYLQLDEDLLFAETDLSIEMLGGLGRREGTRAVGEPDSEEVTRARARLTELTDAWRRARDADPLRVLGLVPARASPASLVTHVFAHAGWLHLAGNLFFLWLVGPPLEDVWGRRLFAALFLWCGVLAGLGWVARYPNSEVEVVGVSGAISGLMGAFLVRFWGTRLRFVYAVWMSLRVYSGFFTAPTWIMLALWLVRELFFASIFEPHVSPGDGIAAWAHIFGFSAGAVAALALRLSRLEERWVRPRVLTGVGEIENRAVERAGDFRQGGEVEKAWSLLRERVTSHPRDRDAVLAWWDLAEQLGRRAEVVPYARRVARELARDGEAQLSLDYWRELTIETGRDEMPPGVALSIAEGLVGDPGRRDDVISLLARARAGIDPGESTGLWLRLARVSRRAALPGARSLCLRLAERPDLPAEVRTELLALGRDGMLASFPDDEPLRMPEEN